MGKQGGVMTLTSALGPGVHMELPGNKGQASVGPDWGLDYAVNKCPRSD